MPTRAGSLDPGLLLHLLAAGVVREELDDALNHRSGLFGLSDLHGPPTAACSTAQRSSESSR